MQRYDVVIIGGGSAGYSAALRAAQLGLFVALVEESLVGGTCLHRGCIPTKALLQAAATADTVRDAAGFGIGATLTGVDAATIVAYQDEVVGKLHAGLTGLLSAAQVRVIEGRGELTTDPLSVRVADEVLHASTVIVATGATPVTLGLPIDGQRIITSEHALRLTTLPERAIVLGGGVIGAEFASAWASLGVQVTIIEALDRLVPGEEPDTSVALARAFKQRGITVKLKTRVSGAEATANGVRVALGDAHLDADLLLVAVGRRADPAAAGLPGLAVNDDLTTSVANVFAAGDLVPGPQLAHRGYLHGSYLAELIAHQLGRQPKRPSRPADATIPRVTYSSPEIVSVGLTSEQASQDGEIEVVDYALTGNGKAQILAGRDHRVRGNVRIIRRKGAEIVGVHVVGEHVAELVGEANLLVNWDVVPADLASIAHAHPTLGEALGEAALALAGKPLHMHP